MSFLRRKNSSIKFAFFQNLICNLAYTQDVNKSLTNGKSNKESKETIIVKNYLRINYSRKTQSKEKHWTRVPAVLLFSVSFIRFREFTQNLKNYFQYTKDDFFFLQLLDTTIEGSNNHDVYLKHLITYSIQNLRSINLDVLRYCRTWFKSKGKQ